MYVRSHTPTLFNTRSFSQKRFYEANIFDFFSFLSLEPTNSCWKYGYNLHSSLKCVTTVFHSIFSEMSVVVKLSVLLAQCAVKKLSKKNIQHTCSRILEFFLTAMRFSCICCVCCTINVTYRLAAFSHSLANFENVSKVSKVRR